jgi:hypothetical protein
MIESKENCKNYHVDFLIYQAMQNKNKSLFKNNSVDANGFGMIIK